MQVVDYCLRLLTRRGFAIPTLYCRSLLEHVRSTYLLLKAHERPFEEQIVGLMHSTYGPAFGYDFSGLLPSERSNVAELVGAPAEALVWTYCAAQSHRGLLNPMRLSDGWQVATNSGPEPIQSASMICLANVQALDLIEQCIYLTETSKQFKYSDLKPHVERLMTTLELCAPAVQATVRIYMDKCRIA